MALTTLEKADTAAQVISDFSKKNDTGIGKVLKDTEASAVKEKITTAPDKTKSDAYVGTIEEDHKGLSPEQKNAIWQSAVIREEAPNKPDDTKVQALVKADRDVEEGKVADLDKHIENTDAARGELHTYIRDLEAKKLTGKASPEEIAEMKLLKEERDKADTSKTFISSNGAAIRINGSAITELTAEDTD